jgi:methionyl-tRNA formyltransferase
MNIVFIGASKFSLRCLKLLNELECCTVTGVVSASENFQISYSDNGVKNILYADVASYCKENDLEYKVISRSMNDDYLFSKVKEWQPTIFLVVGWYHMIPKYWREVAPAYGLHASLLPDYSGGAPLVWAMINGEKETGITLFQMDDGVDSGPLVGQVKEKIRSDDSIATLYSRIENRGLELIVEHIPKIALNTHQLKKQNKSQRRVFPQRTQEDGKIDWKQSALFIDRFIRAQTKPYPGAFSLLNGRKITFWKVELDLVNGILIQECGLVNKIGDSYEISTGKDKIKLKEVEYNGRTYQRKQLSKIFGGGGQNLV